MNCTRCHGSDIDSAGICRTCGHDESDWKKKLDQRLQAMSEKEEEIKQNLHNIIDAAVSRQAKYSSSPEPGVSPSIPAQEKFIFPEFSKPEFSKNNEAIVKDKAEQSAGLFFNTGGDTHNASDAGDLSYTAILDVPYISDAQGILYEDALVDDGDVWDIDDIAVVDEEDIAVVDEDVAIDDSDVADDEDIAIDDEDIADLADINNNDNDTGAENAPTIVYLPITSNEITPNMVPDEQRSHLNLQSEIQNPKSEIRPAGGISPYLLNDSNPEGRLIFLSRTLSGLIDLFLIAIFTGIFLCASDFFTNATVMSSITAASFSVLFLMIYFLYSIFFLGTNGQTIGMVMTDLRVTGMNEKQPLLSQVVHRNAVFLISLFGLGIGLLAGVISRENLCLHDRMSKTRVIRTFEETED